jgi:hypothetical protein
MGATLATFQNILKEFYIGPVIEELNNEIFVLEMFEKAVVDWQGRVAIIPVHVSRNSGVGFRQEGGTTTGAGAPSALPDAGNQGFNRLQINAQYQYGRFEITGPAISAAKSGGKGAFIGYVDAEMKKLVTDVKISANTVSVCGNAVRGYVSEKAVFAPGDSGNAQDVGNINTWGTAGGNPCVLDYTGDYTAWAGATDGIANIATWVPVKLIRTDTHEQIVLSDNPGNQNFFVVGSDATAGTISLRFGEDVGNKQLDLTVTAPGYGVAVALAFKNSVDADGDACGLQLATPNTTIAQSMMQLEPVGMYGNVSDTSFFGINRDPAQPSPEPALRGHAFNASTAGGAFAGLTALSLTRMQQCLDAPLVDGLGVAASATGTHAYQTGTLPDGGGKEADIIMMNSLTRQQYTALLQGTNAGNLYVTTDSAKNGDGGFMSLGYAGIPIKTSRAIHRGILAFLRKDTWNITELESAGFADMDGNVLSRVPDVDAYRGFYRWYWNLVCKQPNCNVILFGVALN